MFCAFRILLFGERRAADDETEDTLRGPLRGHSGEPRRRVRALPQTKRSAAVALGVSSRPLHDRRVYRPLVQIETHARYFRSSKYQSRWLDCLEWTFIRFRLPKVRKAQIALQILSGILKPIHHGLKKRDASDAPNASSEMSDHSIMSHIDLLA